MNENQKTERTTISMPSKKEQAYRDFQFENRIRDFSKAMVSLADAGLWAYQNGYRGKPPQNGAQP